MTIDTRGVNFGVKCLGDWFGEGLENGKQHYPQKTCESLLSLLVCPWPMPTLGCEIVPTPVSSNFPAVAQRLRSSRGHSEWVF